MFHTLPRRWHLWVRWRGHPNGKAKVRWMEESQGRNRQLTFVSGMVFSLSRKAYSRQNLLLEDETSKSLESCLLDVCSLDQDNFG